MANLITVHNGALELAGKPVRLRGVNLGSWINIEDFMFGLSGVERRGAGHAAAVVLVRAGAAGRAAARGSHGHARLVAAGRLHGQHGRG